MGDSPKRSKKSAAFRPNRWSPALDQYQIYVELYCFRQSRMEFEGQELLLPYSYKHDHLISNASISMVWFARKSRKEALCSNFVLWIGNNGQCSCVLKTSYGLIIFYLPFIDLVYYMFKCMSDYSSQGSLIASLFLPCSNQGWCCWDSIAWLYEISFCQQIIQKNKVQWTPSTVEPLGNNQDYCRRSTRLLHQIPFQERPVTSYAYERPRLQSEAAKGTITHRREAVCNPKYHLLWVGLRFGI